MADTGDNFTKRMRPTFGYVICFVLLWNYTITGLLGREPVALPEALFWLFGSYMLGYTGARSWEKYTAFLNGNGKTEEKK